MINADEMLRALNDRRLLVFLETDDGSAFRQIILNHEQFQKVSDAIVRSKVEDGKPGHEIVEVEEGDKDFDPDIFIGCQSIYEDD